MTDENKQLSDAEHIIAMKNSRGWKIVEKRYSEIVKEISDLRTIPLKIEDRELTTEERMKEMIKREAALSLLEILFSGLTTDVDAFHEAMNHSMKKDEEDHIKRFE